ncbi:uncharacterized protein LOC113315145 [Papaver somniferum]|uniref:uncharacterized protein LOC113315145 n=1 Tax=Papaver somniferum TaxID=3469 RepID=UPI000E6F58B3|nr:uncharacterized protein LOC113315145 [Papaver somniferum]
MAPSKRRRGGSKKSSSAAAKKRKKSGNKTEIPTENELPQEEEEGKEIETVVVEIEEIPADPPVVPSIPVEPPVDFGKASSTAKNGEKLGNENEISSENVLTQEEEVEIEEIPADPPVVPSISVEPHVDCDKASSTAKNGEKLGNKNEISSENLLTQEEEEEERVVEQTLAPILSAVETLVDLYSDSAPNTKLPCRRAVKSGRDSPVGDVSSEQQQLCEDQTAVEVVDCTQDDNKEKGKVDLTQSFVSDQVFDSPDALIEWCQEVGRKTMSVIVVTKSRKPVLGRPAMLELGCERGGVDQDHNKKTDTPTLKDLTKKRESRPRKCGCPFTLKGVWMEGDKWKVRVHCGAHNHELPEMLVGHSDVDRSKEEQKEILVDLTKSGVRHRRVLSPLKHRSRENMSRMRTIYNYSAAIKLTEVEGKSVMHSPSSVNVSTMKTVENASSAIKLTEVEGKSAMHTPSSVNVSTMKTVENASSAIKLSEVEGKSAMHTPSSVNVSAMKTVENASAAIKLTEVEGKSAMQQVLGLLLKHHYVEWHRRDEKSDELKDIFWAHPESLQLVLGFHSVLIVDSTYKTNRFGSPLLRIVGVTSTGKLFTVAFIILEAETEDHYVWALTRLKRLFSPNALPSTFVTDGELKLVNAIGTVFPKAKWLFCSLHVLKKVSENCKQYFESDEEFERFMKEWTNLTHVRTKDEYADAFCDFVLTWTSYPGCIQYLRDNWLRHKEHYVPAWTKFIKHFGNTSINRVGSSHAILKSQLAANNFSICWTTMHKMISDEIIDIKASFEKSLTSVPDEYLLPAFKELRGCVSHKAMEFLLLEHSRSEDVGFDVGVCGCVLRLSYGLPCAHEIVQYFRNGTEIPLSKIDSQWKLLSTIPVPEEHSEFDYLPELKSVRERWEKASKFERKIMQKKLEETACL